MCVCVYLCMYMLVQMYPFIHTHTQTVNSKITIMKGHRYMFFTESAFFHAHTHTHTQTVNSKITIMVGCIYMFSTESVFFKEHHVPVLPKETKFPFLSPLQNSNMQHLSSVFFYRSMSESQSYIIKERSRVVYHFAFSMSESCAMRKDEGLV